ncbi:MAG: hypothetical protein IT204_25655 [Fimbriimonadaceae bacterium]|nr:hypothetical protein [Fimbriimonadaceae bacterium]
MTPTPVFERLWHRTLDRLLAETTATVVLLTLPLLTQLPMLRVWSHLPRLQALAGATVDEFNAVIRASVARSPRLVLADVEPEIRRILRAGQSVTGWQLPCQVRRGYLDFEPLRGLRRQVWSGGLITFDGLHPTHTGTALLTNVVIDALRARGWNVPRIDLAAVARDDDLLQHPSPHSWAALRYYLRRNYDRSVETTTARTWPIELRRGREV